MTKFLLTIVIERPAFPSKYVEESVIFFSSSFDKSVWKEVKLYLERIEAEYINTNIEQATQLSDIAIKHAKTVLDRAKISALKIKFFLFPVLNT